MIWEGEMNAYRTTARIVGLLFVAGMVIGIGGVYSSATASACPMSLQACLRILRPCLALLSSSAVEVLCSWVKLSRGSVPAVGLRVSGSERARDPQCLRQTLHLYFEQNLLATVLGDLEVHHFVNLWLSSRMISWDSGSKRLSAMAARANLVGNGAGGAGGSRRETRPTEERVYSTRVRSVA
jgi:hypothetical protein